VGPLSLSPHLTAALGPVPFPAAAEGSNGWFYSLLTQAGATPSTARSVNNFVLRPLEIVLVVVVAALVSHFGAKAIRRVLDKMASQAAVQRAGRPAPRVSTLIALMSNLWRLLVAIVAIAIILGMLGIDLTPILASATIIGATIGFGAQSLVRDYLSGILLTMEDQFAIGDTIVVGGTSGVVEDLSFRVTRLRNVDGSVCYVPNGDIRQLANASRGWAKAVVDVPVAAAGTEPLERVRQLVTEAANAVASSPSFAATCTEPPEVVGMVGVDADHCTMRVALHTTPARRVALERALRAEIVARLGDHGLWPTGASPDPETT
jgi:small conductance mechanosensitive channel